MGFTFRKEVRGFVKNLAKLLYYANAQNSGKWAWQTTGKGWEECGVFGQAYGAVMAIIREECGEVVALECHREGFNFGGNADFLDDIETLIDEVTNRYSVAIVNDLGEVCSYLATENGQTVQTGFHPNAQRFTLESDAKAIAEKFIAEHKGIRLTNGEPTEFDFHYEIWDNK